MSLNLTPELQKHLGLLPLNLKDSVPVEQVTSVEHTEVTAVAVEKPTQITPSMPKPELEKNEFRLLVKILQAIGHECVFDLITYENGSVHYAHPNKELVFGDITLNDDPHTMNLSSLKDMNQDSVLKRAVWEKLKTL